MKPFIFAPMWLRIFLILFAFQNVCHAQERSFTLGADVNYFYGNIMAHSPDLNHFLAGHPEGVMLGLVKQTYGHHAWEQVYNYPDYGLYVLYQDFKNPILGHNYAIGFQYNFYFLKRRLQLKIAQGLAMNSNPHDNVTNYRNSAFSTTLMENTNFALNFRQKLWKQFHLQAGFIFTHFSNGRIKAPNSGVNTYNINVGVNYNLSPAKNYLRDTAALATITDKIRWNFILRSGVNESLIANSGQYVFYHPGVYADKRISRKFALQAGAEVFFSNYQKHFIAYKAAAYPELGISASTDWKRVGTFIGTELFVNKLSLEAQVGYYVYKPLKIEQPVYQRVGAKYYFYKNLFTGVSVKTNGFLAEAMEFNLGIRL